MFQSWIRTSENEFPLKLAIRENICLLFLREESKQRIKDL